MAVSNPWTSARIKDLRQRAELPQARMAARLGVELAIYQGWESESEAPALEDTACLESLAGAETARVLPVFHRAIREMLALRAGGALFAWDRTMGCYRCYPADTRDSLPPGVDVLVSFENVAALEAALGVT